MMIAHEIEDVAEPASVEGMDRSELIAALRALESQRSAWELRIRICEERELLWKQLMKDSMQLLARTFQDCHNAVGACAEEAAKLADEMAQIGKNVEDM